MVHSVKRSHSATEQEGRKRDSVNHRIRKWRSLGSKGQNQETCGKCILQKGDMIEEERRQ